MVEIELVVIGGSAGALDPLLEIVAALDPAIDVPIAVVLHVSPRAPSRLPEVVAGATSRRVREPEDKEPLERNTIYIAPPGYHMLVERTRTVALSIDAPVSYARPSIDVLFESAANAIGPRVAGIVLSGTNHDGAEGLAQIAAAGGMAIVQAPASATHPSMPAAAAARVPMARTLAARDIPSVLLTLARFPREHLGASS